MASPRCAALSVVAKGERHKQRFGRRIRAVESNKHAPLAGDIDLLGAHFVEGQRARLVGTDEAHRTQCFNGGQPPYQGVAARHGAGAQSQHHGDHRRQGFGNGGDCKAQRRQQHEQERLPPPDAEGEEDGADRPVSRRPVAARTRQGALWSGACAGSDGFQQAGDLAKLGRHAGRDRNTATRGRRSRRFP